MTHGRARRAQRLPVDLGLVGLSALVWLAAVYLNNKVLFPWPEEVDFLHWIFVPAGLRVLLVMLFGWRAAVGMALGSVPWMLDVLPGAGAGTVAIAAIGTGLMPWLSIRLFSAATGVRHPWSDLLWWHLPAIAALSAFAHSAVLNSQLILFGFEPPRELATNLLSVMIGDFMGALVMLLASVALVRLLRALGPDPTGTR